MQCYNKYTPNLCSTETSTLTIKNNKNEKKKEEKWKIEFKIQYSDIQFSSEAEEMK